MKDLTISLVQANQVWEDKTANFELYENLLKDVPAECELILLPEMFQTSFSMRTELAEDFQHSESIQWLKEKASQHQAAIYTSLMIRDSGKITNRGVFVYPVGKVEYYDKQKTFTLAGEHEHFEKGRSVKIIEFQGWKIQLNICYDLRFPEILRNSWDSANQTSSYDVLIFVANWPTKRGEHWRTLLKARAIENQCYVAAVNRVGNDKKGLSYNGDSVIIDALGIQKNDFSSEQGVQTCVLEFKGLQEMRKSLPFLQDQNVTITG